MRRFRLNYLLLMTAALAGVGCRDHAAKPTPGVIARPAMPAAPLIIKPFSPEVARYIGTGWSFPQKDHRWTIAKSAIINLPADLGVYSRVSLRANTLVPMGIDLLVNDNYIGTFNSDSRRVKTEEFIIPASMLTGKGNNRLELRVPRVVSPAEVNPNNKEKRLLGVMVYEIVLLP